MIVLGIESTCDETGCALVLDGKTILSNIVASQADLHSTFGGVVPELACRLHVEKCRPVLEKALTEANLSPSQIDLIAVAQAPGLIGALLIGLNFAKGLALALDKPLIGVNHLEAHLYSALMEKEVPFPALGVIISGGHTALVLVKGVGDYSFIGQTQDDAIGEAFDKTAKLLDLPYPGGPHLEKLATLGDPSRFPFKGGQLKNRPYDFSFSGLKTAVLYKIRGQNGKNRETELTLQDKRDIAAGFQLAAFSDLLEKSMKAAKEHQCQSIILGGGVTQNRFLRTLFESTSQIPLFWPSKELCLDNAAMIAGLGYHLYLKNGADNLELSALPRIDLCGKFSSPSYSLA